MQELMKVPFEDFYDTILTMIQENYKKYFTNKILIEDYIAQFYGLSLIRLRAEKLAGSPIFERERAYLKGKLRRVLTKLKDDGVVEKYNFRTWKKLK